MFRMEHSGIHIAVSKAGGQTALAARLTEHYNHEIQIIQPTVSKWLRGLHPVPAEHLEAIEAVSGVAPSIVRPDLKGILAR